MKLTEKQHERIEKNMIKMAAQIEQYCADYVGYCDCGDDGRPCVFYAVDEQGEPYCWLFDKPKHWMIDVLEMKKNDKR